MKPTIPRGWRRLRVGTKPTPKDRWWSCTWSQWYSVDHDDAQTVAMGELIIRRVAGKGKRK